MNSYLKSSAPGLFLSVGTVTQHMLTQPCRMKVDVSVGGGDQAEGFRQKGD